MRAALTWVRANADRYGIDPDFFRKLDLHVHVPSGAIPKDGPSAGVAMVTALVSLLTGRPVRPRVAMTGEISLSGIVLPIGGVKEKVLGAKRAGIKEVILPSENEPNVKEDLQPEMLEGIEIHFVRTAEQALDIALGNRRNARREQAARGGPAPLNSRFARYGRLRQPKLNRGPERNLRALFLCRTELFYWQACSQRDRGARTTFLVAERRVFA